MRGQRLDGKFPRRDNLLWKNGPNKLRGRRAEKPVAVQENEWILAN